MLKVLVNWSFKFSVQTYFNFSRSDKLARIDDKFSAPLWHFDNHDNCLKLHLPVNISWDLWNLHYCHITCSTHFINISDSQRPTRDTSNSKCHRTWTRNSNISIIFVNPHFRINYYFCYILPLFIVLVYICFMLQFSMLLCQAVLCLNRFTVYYLFKQSWKDEYIFLSSATYHTPSLCPCKRLFEMWKHGESWTPSSLFF